MATGSLQWAAVVPSGELFSLAGVWAVAKLLAALARRVGQLGILGELLAGIVLGPAVLGLLHPTDLLRVLAEVGVILLMFLAGLETHVGEFRRHAASAFWVALAGVVLPFGGGWLVARSFGADPLHALFTGVLLVATSVSISAETLRQMGLLERREGATVLAAAVYDDVLGLLALTLVLGIGAGEGSSVGLQVGRQLLRVLAFVGLSLLVARGVAAALEASRRAPLAELTPALAASLALLFAAGAEYAGLAGILGAYFLGLLLKVYRPPLAADLEHRLSGPTVTYFTPFFFVSVGLLLPATLPGGGVWRRPPSHALLRLPPAPTSARRTSPRASADPAAATSGSGYVEAGIPKNCPKMGTPQQAFIAHIRVPAAVRR